jgi:predicted transposase YbfD/YdcC
MASLQDTSWGAWMETLPDPRDPRGRRYPWAFLLTVMAAALLSGPRSVRAMAQWAQDHAAAVRQAWPRPPPRLPCAATCAHGPPMQLLSVVRHGSGTVLAQVAIEPQTNEIGAAPALLARCTLPGTVTTCDALLSQQALARQILTQGGDYLMIIKDNQPTLHQDLIDFFTHFAFPRREDDRQRYRETSKGHGRRETRTVTCSALLTPYLAWPGVQQVLERRCLRVQGKSGQQQESVSYAVTSLSRERAGAQALAQLWRGHWTIENQTHYVRDETWGEDRSPLWRGTAPQALAVLRNALWAALRDHGWTNIAEALRHYGASVSRACAFLAGNAS